MPKLFGNKPGHLSEEAYVGQFQSSAASLFGTEGANDFDAIRAGLRSGESRDVTRSLAYDRESLDNMSFALRLAIAAREIEKIT